MTKDKFAEILTAAMAGDHGALEMLLKLYKPIIDKQCYIGGVLDEDLRQYILIHIALNISKFPL